MNMILVGYLMAMVNDQTFGESSGSYEDIKINEGKLGYLTTQLSAERLFSLEDFSETCFSRVGAVGKFLSPNLCHYLYHKTGDGNEEGFILTIYYKMPESKEEFDAKDNAMVSHGRDEVASEEEGLKKILEKIKADRHKGSNGKSDV